MLAAVKRFLAPLVQPITPEKRALLEKRWNELPAELRTDWQVVGRQITHCAYTLGPAYCSLGCTHCYLPANANKMPLPTLEQMKQQIDANRRDLGPGGSLQVTGGDVVDAYWRSGRADELVEVLRYAHERELVPMLMTHGQVLLDEPDYFVELVREGLLRKVAIHVDITQAGRPGYPIRSLEREGDLNPLRERFVRLIEDVRARTGARVTAAHTVTVTARNIDSLGDIASWLTSDPRNLRVFGMLSLQTEAAVGRTRMSTRPVGSDQVWSTICSALGAVIPRDGTAFGHPDCSSWAVMLVDTVAGSVINLLETDERSRRYWRRMLEVFGGVGSREPDTMQANLRRLGLFLRQPGFAFESIAYLFYRLRRDRIRIEHWRRFLAGKLLPLSLVQHDFMDAGQVAAGGPVVEARLAACSFRGAVERGGEWVSVPMCTMNALEREPLPASSGTRRCWRSPSACSSSCSTSACASRNIATASRP